MRAGTEASGATGFGRRFGPGLLWAAAAIGVSHLVQSTRAGADAGLGLAWVLLVACLLKYPFFEVGPRYAAATGRSLVEGYRSIGIGALALYLGITLGTAVVVQAAVLFFTAHLVRFAFGLEVPVPVVAGGLCAGGAALLALGRFRALDGFVKIILALLALSTVAAAALSLPRLEGASATPWPLAERSVPFAFLLALVGWMPSAIDVSVWSSLWTQAKDREVGGRTTVPAALLDFRIGYLGTTALALAFVVLGASVMHGSGERFPSSGAAFSLQLVDLYARSLGEWMRPVVLVAVLTTMISTSITVIDGFPRAIDRGVRNLVTPDPPASGGAGVGRTYWFGLAALALATVVVLDRFLGSLTAMVDFATTLSFLTAPILGWLNLRVITSEAVPAVHRPGRLWLALAWSGLVGLGGVAVAYGITRL